MNLINKLPLSCPSCESLLSVSRMHCLSCQTNVEGSYKLPILAQLNNEEQQFVISFLKSSGSIKEMSNQMEKSYPTMRNLLDDLIEKVKTLENK